MIIRERNIDGKFYSVEVKGSKHRGLAAKYGVEGMNTCHYIMKKENYLAFKKEAE